MIAVLALVVAACGSTNPESANPSTGPTSAPPVASATPTPSASPSPSPTASPSPSADIGAIVIGKLSGFDFFGKSVISGELDVAAARYPISGSFDISGLNSHQVLTVQAPGAQSQETITVNGTTYNRTGSGPWYAKPPTLDSTGLGGFFRTLKTMTDAGVESKNGQQLHRLTLPAGTTLPPSALGLTDPSISGASGSIEFWTKDDGTLVVLAAKATWQQKNAAGALVDTAMAFEFAFTDVGTSFTISPPEETWIPYTSKINHASMAYPSDWDLFAAKKTGKFDEFDGPIYAFTSFGRYAAKGVSLNTLVRALVAKGPSYVTKYKVDKVTSTKLGGVSARQLLIHATYKGTKQYWVVVIALKGSYFYELDVIDTTGHEAETRALAALFLTTVALK